jgi:hypothetical protein
MSYVVVEDVAASWENYDSYAQALESVAPPGLIVHAAGPTDEGFRIVGVWESEAAWHRFAAGLGPGAAFGRQVRRTLSPEHVVYGPKEER